MAPLPNAAEAPPESLSPAASVPCSCLFSSAFRRLIPPRSRSPTQRNDLFAASRHILAWANALGVSSKPFLNAADDFRIFLQRQFRIPNNRISCGSSLSTLKFAAILPGDSVAGLVVASGLTNFLNIYNTLLVVRLLLTWFPGVPTAIVSPLSTLCDPYLNIFRGVIPPLGGTLDLSPILAFLVLNAFTSTAAALPAELPESLKSQRLVSSPGMLSNLTTPQEKWMKRVCSKQEKH